MTILVCGSVAIDRIMFFDGLFSEEISPNNLSALSVCFVSHNMRREFGGCAANIAYALKRLGANPLIAATVGADATDYIDRFDQLDIARHFIKVIPNAYTAQAFITTDRAGHQITVFHPGAMEYAHENDIRLGAPYELAIVSPDSKQAMLRHASSLSEMGCPFLFDPGQAIPLFSKSELLSCIELSNWLICNAYEAELLEQKIGMPLQKIAQQLQAVIVTKGEKGATIFSSADLIAIPPVFVEPQHLKDVTGCGDAFRAGILYGLMQRWAWEKIGRLASLMGALKAISMGAQGDISSFKQIQEAFQRNFSEYF